MTDTEEYIEMPDGQDCQRCGEPVHNNAGFIWAAEFWHVDCYEEEYGALPEVEEEHVPNDNWDDVRGF